MGLPVGQPSDVADVVGPATSSRSCHPRVSASRGVRHHYRLADPNPIQVAGSVNLDPRVGAIFVDGGAVRVYAGSVVHSTDGDLVLTAPLCMSGSFQVTLTPGLSDDAAPTRRATSRSTLFRSTLDRHQGSAR